MVLVSKNCEAWKIVYPSPPVSAVRLSVAISERHAYPMPIRNPVRSGTTAAGRITCRNTSARLAAKELFTSTSIGIAVAGPQYRRPEELLRDADSAMYRAKAEGRHRFALFDDGLRQQALTLLEVENDLRRALTRNEFEPHYQPIVRLADGGIIGYEALMRWRHPERGLLLPGEFLTVAEESGSPRPRANLPMLRF